MTDRLRVTPSDLAALAFRARDPLNAQIDRLKGCSLGEGDQVRIVLTATVQRTPTDALIFGSVTGSLGGE